jgi:hypothetical protein
LGDLRYKALNLPLDADRFVSGLQNEMDEALSRFDAGIKKNHWVRLAPAEDQGKMT